MTVYTCWIELTPIINDQSSAILHEDCVGPSSQFRKYYMQICTPAMMRRLHYYSAGVTARFLETGCEHVNPDFALLRSCRMPWSFADRQDPKAPTLLADHSQNIFSSIFHLNVQTVDSSGIFSAADPIAKLLNPTPWPTNFRLVTGLLGNQKKKRKLLLARRKIILFPSNPERYYQILDI